MIELTHKERIQISLVECDLALACLEKEGITNDTLGFKSLQPLIIALEQMIRMSETPEFREVGQESQRQFFLDYMALIRIIKSQNDIILAMK